MNFPHLMPYRTIFLLGFLPVFAFAQPSTAMRPALLSSLEAEISASSDESIARGGISYGSVSVLTTSLSFSGRHGLDPATTFVYGMAYRNHQLDATSTLLPDQLAELSINLGLQRRFSPKWSGALFVRPGFFSDFEDLSSKSLNMPVLAMFNYTSSPTLTWSFGLNVNPFSEKPVFPIAGVRWQFAEDWTFTVGFPQSGVSWRTSDSVTLRTGVGFNGGSFRITENLGVPAPGINRLANTYLDFREVRAGLGADFKLGPRLTLAMDLGFVTDRKFDYYDRDFILNGDAGFFGAVALRANF